MLFDFFKETISLYSSNEEYFPVIVTRVRDYKEIEEGKSDYYLVGYRVDKPQSVVTIIHPFRNEIPVEVGDYILVKNLGEGFSIFIAKLHRRVPLEEQEKYQEKFFAKPSLPQLAEKKVFGSVYNSSPIYATYTSSYQKRVKEFLYKRFVEFPSYDIYKSTYDIFDYDEVFWEILNDDGENYYSRKYIFHLADNPTIKDYLYSRNSDENFPFRPDIVFDYLEEKNAINTQEKLLSLKEKIELFKYSKDSDKYPFVQALDEVDDSVKYTSYDEILDENKKNEYLDRDIFYAQEFKEIKLGRNKLGVYKINKQDTFLLLKSTQDQQVSLLSFRNNNQVRIRNSDGSLVFLESNEDFSRSMILNYPSLLFEEFYKQGYQHVLLSNIEKADFNSIQKSGSSPSDYSFLLLRRGNKDESLKRTDFIYTSLDDSQTVVLGTKKFNSYSFSSFSSNDDGSRLNERVEKTFYVDIYAFSEDACYKVENNKDGINYFTFCGDTFTINKNLHVLGPTNIDGRLTVRSNTFINGNLFVSGIVVASGFVIGTAPEEGDDDVGGIGSGDNEGGDWGGSDGSYSSLIALSYYTFVQEEPSTTWIINHGLGYQPNVSVYSMGGVEMEAEIIHTSDNQTIINFSLPTSGYARLL